MSDLEKHFPTQMNLLRQVDNKLKRSQNEIRELNEIVLQLKNTNIILQESETKLNKKINDYNNQIYNDSKILNDYYKMKNENEILKTEKKSLTNLVFNLEQKIKQIEIDNKRNIENIKNNFKTKEKALEEQIESLQASYTLDNFEKESDMKKIKYDYEQQLENAIKREQNLKIELFDLKHQMTASNSVLNKKISELQEKTKRFENNRPSSSNYTQKNTSFISAKNILNISKNPTASTSTLDFQRNSINKISSNQSNSNTQIQNTVNINKIEINPVKKFQFRKQQSSAKKLLSEDFDPFKMHKETSSLYNFQNDSALQMGSDYSCIIDDSLVEAEENIRENKIEIDDFDEDIGSCIIQPESTSRKNNNCRNSVPKKRKLFNPNNFDYLE